MTAAEVADVPSIPWQRSPELVTLNAPRSPAAEAYRTLRTNIQFAGLDRPIRTLLLTSPGPGEGKTTALANLAVASAEAGLRVIAVDTDLRRPSLHHLFGVAQTPGLSTAVQADEDEPLPLQECGVPGLLIVSSGTVPANAAEVVASPRAAQLLEALAKRADLVLLDSPPVTPFADAAVLASRADAVLLVLRAGKTTRDAARRALAQLERVGARVLGSVLTDARLDPALAKYYSGR